MQPLLPTGGLGKKAEAEEQGSLASGNFVRERGEEEAERRNNNRRDASRRLHHLAKIDNTGKGGCNAL